VIAKVAIGTEAVNLPVVAIVGLMVLSPQPTSPKLVRNNHSQNIAEVKLFLFFNLHSRLPKGRIAVTQQLQANPIENLGKFGQIAAQD
jgi:hypothetical protein